MLKGVVQRYASNMMMTKVEQIIVGKLQESTSVALPVFENTCRYIASHSQPIAAQAICPPLDELKATISSLSRPGEAMLADDK